MKLSVQILSALLVLVLIIVVLERDSILSNSHTGLEETNNKEHEELRPRDTSDELAEPNIVDYTSILKQLIMAEDRYDEELAASFFADEIHRFWDLYDITNSDLKKLYTTVYSKRSDAYNNVISIDRIGEREYILDTEFHCKRISTGEDLVVRSKIKFVFNSDGKIIETYKINE